MCRLRQPLEINIIGYSFKIVMQKTGGEEMLGTGDKFSTLVDAVVLPGGGRVAFTIKTVSGKELRVNCALAELGDIFSYLGTLAKAAGEARNAPEPLNLQTHNYLAPIPAQGIGLQAGEKSGETLLVVRLAGFDMAFSVESSGIVRLADEFVRKAHTLSAGKDQLH
jgi:hypothetical protein